MRFLSGLTMIKIHITAVFMTMGRKIKITCTGGPWRTLPSGAISGRRLPQRTIRWLASTPSSKLAIPTPLDLRLCHG
ncbi:hypothetical protein BDN70DRAFT_154019 [Pholiota conissans]|uniref:Uncharacterized protein n=1 Tax=Pholiota conissans TaxID=109636 RepID=A0A9P6CYK1_9AGAR|nr:hypothetical protein BDN70DRAFT_154019 [Pholiota conissans]